MPNGTIQISDSNSGIEFCVISLIMWCIVLCWIFIDDECYWIEIKLVNIIIIITIWGYLYNMLAVSWYFNKNRFLIINVFKIFPIKIDVKLIYYSGFNNSDFNKVSCINFCFINNYRNAFNIFCNIDFEIFAVLICIGFINIFHSEIMHSLT